MRVRIIVLNCRTQQDTDQLW